MSTSLVIGPVRVSFFHGWEPKAPKGSTKLVYSSQLVFDSSDKKTVDAVNQAIAEARDEGKAKLDGIKPSKLRMPLYDGEEEFPGDDFYKGKMYLNASNTRQPEICKKVNGKLQPIMDEDELYSGAWVYASVNFFAYNNVGAGIGCSLQHILKYKDGPRLDTKISAEKAFEGVDFAETEEDEKVKESAPKAGPKKETKKESKKQDTDSDSDTEDDEDPFA